MIIALVVTDGYRASDASRRIAAQHKAAGWFDAATVVAARKLSVSYPAQYMSHLAGR